MGKEGLTAAHEDAAHGKGDVEFATFDRQIAAAKQNLESARLAEEEQRKILSDLQKKSAAAQKSLKTANQEKANFYSDCISSLMGEVWPHTGGYVTKELTPTNPEDIALQETLSTCGKDVIQYLIEQRIKQSSDWHNEFHGYREWCESNINHSLGYIVKKLLDFTEDNSPARQNVIDCCIELLPKFIDRQGFDEYRSGRINEIMTGLIKRSSASEFHGNIVKMIESYPGIIADHVVLKRNMIEGIAILTEHGTEANRENLRSMMNQACSALPRYDSNKARFEEAMLDHARFRKPYIRNSEMNMAI